MDTPFMALLMLMRACKKFINVKYVQSACNKFLMFASYFAWVFNLGHLFNIEVQL